MSDECSRCDKELKESDSVVFIKSTYGELMLCEEHAEELFDIVRTAKERAWDEYFDLCLELHDRQFKIKINKE